MPDTDRWLALQGTANTRDLGGLPLVGGGATVPGRVLRSDDLQALTEQDVHLLVDDLGVTDVVDLRTSAEVRMEGRGPLRGLPGVTHRHFTLIPEAGEHTDVFAAEDPQADVDLPSDWVETLLPRAVAAGDEDETPAVKSYLGYLSDGAENVWVRCARWPRHPARRSCTARPARTAPAWCAPWPSRSPGWSGRQSSRTTR